MSKIILLTTGTVQMEAELNESKTAALLFDKLPGNTIKLEKA